MFVWCPCPLKLDLKTHTDLVAGGAVENIKQSVFAVNTTAQMPFPRNKDVLVAPVAPCNFWTVSWVFFLSARLQMWQTSRPPLTYSSCTIERSPHRQRQPDRWWSAFKEPCSIKEYISPSLQNPKPNMDACRHLPPTRSPGGAQPCEATATPPSLRKQRTSLVVNFMDLILLEPRACSHRLGKHADTDIQENLSI